MRSGLIVATFGALSVACLLLAAMLFYVAVRGGTETAGLVVAGIAFVVGVVPGAAFGAFAYLVGRSAPAH